MQTIVPLTKDGRIFGTNFTTIHPSPLHPPFVIGGEYLGEKITLEVPRLVPIDSLGGLKIVHEKKCVIRFYCREKNGDTTSQGNGSPENPFNHTRDAFEFVRCLRRHICADYLQIYLYPDSDEINLSEFLFYGQYDLASGIPVIIGDFDSKTKIKARASSSVVRTTNGATSFLVGMDIKVAAESFGTFILYNCDLAFSRENSSFETSVDDIVNCRVTEGSIYGGRYIFGSTICVYNVSFFREIANSHIELASWRDSDIYLADIVSSSTIIVKIEHNDSYIIYCEADTILDSNFFITRSFLKVKTAIINSNIQCSDIGIYYRQSAVVAGKDIIISKSSINASCHFILRSSLDYSCFGLTGVSISDGGSYSINNLICSLTVTQNASNYYGYKYTCSVAVKGKGCTTDCQIIASGNVGSVGFSCYDIYR